MNQIFPIGWASSYEFQLARKGGVSNQNTHVVTVSYSMLIRNGKRFKSVSHNKKQNNKGNPLAFGRITHRIISLISRGKELDEAMGEVYESAVRSGLGPEELEEIRSMVARVKVPKGETEVFFILPLLENPDEMLYLAKGYIDLVCDDGSIIDWKTNRKIYYPTQDHQLALYAWAIMKLHGVEKVQGTLYFLRHNVAMSHWFTREEAELARMWALSRAQEIETANRTNKKTETTV